MGLQFKLTGEIADELGCDRRWVLEMAKVACLDLDKAGDYLIWSPENEIKIGEIINKTKTPIKSRPTIH